MITDVETSFRVAWYVIYAQTSMHLSIETGGTQWMLRLPLMVFVVSLSQRRLFSPSQVTNLRAACSEFSPVAQVSAFVNATHFRGVTRRLERGIPATYETLTMFPNPELSINTFFYGRLHHCAVNLDSESRVPLK